LPSTSDGNEHRGLDRVIFRKHKPPRQRPRSYTKQMSREGLKQADGLASRCAFIEHTHRPAIKPLGSVVWLTCHCRASATNRRISSICLLVCRRVRLERLPPLFGP
jgi:hypothetical protein